MPSSGSLGWPRGRFAPTACLQVVQLPGLRTRLWTRKDLRDLLGQGPQSPQLLKPYKTVDVQHVK